MNRSPEMQEFVDMFAQAAYGRKPQAGQCVSCGSTAVGYDDFDDDLSRKEYEISRLCMTCQNEVFAEPEE